MLTLLSPAKTLDFESKPSTNKTSQPEFLENAAYLNKKLRKLSAKQLSKLMNISPDLADLNYQRNQEFEIPFTSENARQAILAFKGDVYTGLSAEDFDEKDFEFAQKNLRMLSGLYGLLKPLDLMQPYRLEMGTSFKVTPAKSNLYKYWDKQLTESLNELEHEHLINLASAEYFKAIKPKILDAEVVTPRFLDAKGGEYKMIGFFAKKARGLMARFIIKNKLNNPEDLKGFNLEGYGFNQSLSSENDLVFTREENW